jgi:hypothetical protein
MDRRVFLQPAVAAGIAGQCMSAFPEPDVLRPEFRTANTRWQTAYNRALAVLDANIQVLPRYDKLY